MKKITLLATLLLVSCEDTKKLSSQPQASSQQPQERLSAPATSLSHLKAQLIDRTRTVMQMRVRENLSIISEEIHAEMNKGLFTIFADKKLLNEFTSKGMTEKLATHFPNLLYAEHQAKLIDRVITSALKDINEQDDKVHRRLKTLPNEIQWRLREKFSTEKLKKQLALDLLKPISQTNRINLYDMVNQSGILALGVARKPPVINRLPYRKKILTLTKFGGPIGMILSTAATYAIDDAIQLAKSNKAGDAKRIFTEHSRIFSLKIKDNLQKHLNSYIEQILKSHE